MIKLWIGFALAVPLIAGCASTGRNHASPEQTPTTPPRQSAGLDRETALEVCKPPGEHAYLKRLRCTDGSTPTYSRRGSVGTRHPATEGDEERMLAQMDAQHSLSPGEIDLHILDLYDVVCPEKVYSLFLDMYHCRQPTPDVAPLGLALAENG